MVGIGKCRWVFGVIGSCCSWCLSMLVLSVLILVYSSGSLVWGLVCFSWV